MAETDTQEKTQKEEPKFTQQDLDKHIQERLSRERQKYADYDDLQKFRQEHQATIEVQQQKELEARKEYDKLRDQWGQKENEYKGLLTQREQEIQNMKIHNSLYNEAMKHSAYPDAVDLIKSQATVDKDGSIKIKGRDSNGFETLLPVEEGVKKFLEEKPYLVKATGRTGAGTGAAGSSGTQVDRDLAIELQGAMQSGDRKKAAEIKAAIRAKHSAAGQVLF
jgi:hypothetical protein